MNANEKDTGKLIAFNKKQQKNITEDDKDEVTNEPYSGSDSISLLGSSLLNRQRKRVQSLCDERVGVLEDTV